MPLLIVSQYYHSRHMLCVEYEEDNFLDNAILCVNELEKYKRPNECEQPIRYGDLNSKYFRPESNRYNVNDYGDIYFIIKPTVNELFVDYNEYILQSYKESRPYQKRKVIDDIAQHHDRPCVFSIVEKYFKII